MIQHAAPISGIATGPDRLIATAGYDNRLILWRERTAIACAYHDHLVNHCSFDASGRYLVSASSDYTARIWSVPDLRLLSVLGDHEDDVEMCAFDSSGEYVATASRDHSVRIFHRSGQPLHRLNGHEADVLSVSWARNRFLISSSDDGTLRRWDALEGKLLEVVRVGLETDTVVVDGSGTVFAGSDDGHIIVASAHSTERVLAHTSGVKRLALNAAGTTLVSSAYDGTLKTWDVAGTHPKLLTATKLPNVAWARGVALDVEGRVFVGTFGSTYAMYDPREDSWNVDSVYDTPGLNAVETDRGSVFAVGDAGRVLRDGEEIAQLGSLCNFLTRWGRRVVAGGHIGCLFDAQSGSELYRHHAPLNCAAELPNGDLLVGTYGGEGLWLRDDGGRASLRQRVALHDQAIKGIATNGETVFSVCASGAAAIHSFPSFHSTPLPHAHDRIANGVTALGDGRFASVSRDRCLRLWRGTKATVIPSPHTHSIKCVAVTTNGRFIGTGSYDGTVFLYDLLTEHWGPSIRPTTSGISSLCPGSKPDTLIASSYDGCLYEVHEYGHEEVASRTERTRYPLISSLGVPLVSASVSKSTTRHPSGSSNVRPLPTQ